VWNAAAPSLSTESPGERVSLQDVSLASVLHYALSCCFVHAGKRRGVSSQDTHSFFPSQLQPSVVLWLGNTALAAVMLTRMQVYTRQWRVVQLPWRLRNLRFCGQRVVSADQGLEPENVHLIMGFIYAKPNFIASSTWLRCPAQQRVPGEDGQVGRRVPNAAQPACQQAVVNAGPYVL
jgi:hypothetical protein